jgi:dipeptidyl-peptidase-4
MIDHMAREARSRLSFPRQYARTQRFSLGRPRNFAVSADGTRVAFLRTRGGEDPLTCLWVLDVETASERLLADPMDLLGSAEEALTEQERARRERARETAGGIVGYGVDPDLRVAAFSLAGRLFVVDLATGEGREWPAMGPVFDPRPDPTGGSVAYVSDGRLHVIDPTGRDRVTAGEDDADVHWGMAEFVASEEIHRFRGYWWAPDGRALIAARVDNGPVQTWHIADPSNPAQRPLTVRYPAAGTNNADVSLSVLDLEGGRVDIEWDRDVFPYVIHVNWTRGHPPTLLVQSRDQARWQVLAADPESGATTVVAEERSDSWLNVLPGVPTWTRDGRLVFMREMDDTYRLTLDGEPVTPAGLHLRRAVKATTDVILTASHDDPMDTHVYRVSPTGDLTPLTEAPGVHDAAVGGQTMVVTSATMDSDGPVTVVRLDGEHVCEIRSLAAPPVLRPIVAFLRAGAGDVRTAVLFPDGKPPEQPLPVVLDPYGGPQAQRVMRARPMYLIPQWLANQGFAVLVADGRGTPGRGLTWEKAIRFDLARPPLDDQVEALHAAAEMYPQLDLGRVGIRGWSFGGYLAAAAVLRRPDVFHAAIVGAPVTDWSLYDTHYTERYLGLPGEHPEAYERSSLILDAPKLRRPMLLIHGLADDNVVVAHTLRLSQALLEAGRPHQVLPLSGVTHMTPQEVVTENLLLLQVAFLREALGVTGPGPGQAP